jgi:WD40 repeat protein
VEETRPAATFSIYGTAESLAFSPDGRMLAAAEVNGWAGRNDWIAPEKGLDTTIKLRRVPDGAVVRTLRGHTDVVWSVAWSPDGALVASGARDNTVRLWRVSDGAAVASWSPPTNREHGPNKGVLSVAFSADGQLLAGSGVDSVWIWPLSDRHLMATRPVSSAEVAFSAAGRTVATRGAHSIELWDAADGHVVQSMSDPDAGLCHLTFNRNGTTIASCERRGGIDLRHVPDGRILRVLNGHPEGTWRLAFGTNGLLFSGGIDGDRRLPDLAVPISSVRVWRLSDGKLLAKLPSDEGFIYALAASSDGRWLATGSIGKIALWRVTWS